MSYYVLADCNNFYASCERLFDPGLEGKAVIVLSNNDGCVVARSQEAKKLGIKMGEPFFKIRTLCKHAGVKVFSSNYQLYGDLSERVMNVLSERAPEIEIYSIDEAFLKFPSTITPEEIINTCIDLKKTVKKWVGIPISLGIGPTKVLAKLANDLAKQDRDKGIFNLYDPMTQKELLQSCDVDKIWGVGAGLKIRLNRLGIYTVWQFREADPSMIRKKLGVVGERMLWELRGVCCLPLIEEASSKKSITCSRSFGKTVTKLSDLSEALSSHVTTACIKLREQGSCASAICVFTEAIIDPKAGTRSHHNRISTFSLPTHDTPHIITAAKECLKALFNPNAQYKKCGVILLDLVPTESIVPDFFLGSIDPQRTLLMNTVDAVNGHFGKNTLFYGATGIDRPWKMRSDVRSCHYTTSWDNLKIVLA